MVNSEARSWRGENTKYIGWILGWSVGFFVVSNAIGLIFDGALLLNTPEVIFFFSSFFIPLAAVNTIYLFKRLFLQYCETQTQFLLLKVAGLLTGVGISTILFEYIFLFYGIIDDDYISLGEYQMSPSASEVVTNLFFALVIGVPIFVKQRVKMNAALAMDEKKKELDKLHQLQTQAKLEALQAKINPHFLYNSLNSIASLIHENPDQAEEMVLSLSNLFRYTLNYKGGNFSTVAQEVTMVRTYLDIELIRFQDKLSCEIQVESGLDHLPIPRFLLQPLVENAIKHGTSKLDQGFIRIAIQQVESDLSIVVADNGAPFPTEFGAGYGLKSITDQLELLYKDSHQFGLVNGPEKHVKVVLKNVFTHD